MYVGVYVQMSGLIAWTFIIDVGMLVRRRMLKEYPGGRPPLMVDGLSDSV